MTVSGVQGAAQASLFRAGRMSKTWSSFFFGLI